MNASRDGTRRAVAAAIRRTWATDRANFRSKAEKMAWSGWNRVRCDRKVFCEAQVHRSARPEIFAGDPQNRRHYDPLRLGLCDVLGRVVRRRLCAAHLRPRMRPSGGGAKMRTQS